MEKTKSPASLKHTGKARMTRGKLTDYVIIPSVASSFPGMPRGTEPFLMTMEAAMFSTVQGVKRNATLLRHLRECLDELDQIGESLAAAHLSACIDALIKASKTDENTSISD
ncbi:MAG TPA: hypothetical protein VN222_15675 [Novosphingobium sp.]|nr:hypothetical protein [Novosphingobium sp.]